MTAVEREPSPITLAIETSTRVSFALYEFHVKDIGAVPEEELIGFGRKSREGVRKFTEPIRDHLPESIHVGVHKDKKGVIWTTEYKAQTNDLIETNYQDGKVVIIRLASPFSWSLHGYEIPLLVKEALVREQKTQEE
ncbi:MAG: hypothetical protein NUV69_00390 [Candidatus Curtissbacteria bacterium]|nr:hypothetical protein [Candidatus Curtissbacteria bacterium]